MPATHRPQIGLEHTPLIALVGFVSYVIHELAHGLCGKLLGYDTFVSINKAGLAGGEYAETWHAQLVSAAGPIATIVIGLLGFWLIARHLDRRGALYVFPVVFFSAHMRLIAALVSLSNPNDEASIGQWLGIGMWTLPVVVVVVLGSLAILAGKKLELNWRSWTLCFVVNSVVMTVVVVTESSWPKINI